MGPGRPSLEQLLCLFEPSQNAGSEEPDVRAGFLTRKTRHGLQVRGTGSQPGTGLRAPVRSGRGRSLWAGASGEMPPGRWGCRLGECSSSASALARGDCAREVFGGRGQRRYAATIPTPWRKVRPPFNEAPFSQAACNRAASNRAACNRAAYNRAASNRAASNAAACNAAACNAAASKGDSTP
jgi:hypothetical protein